MPRFVVFTILALFAFSSVNAVPSLGDFSIPSECLESCKGTALLERCNYHLGQVPSADDVLCVCNDTKVLNEAKACSTCVTKATGKADILQAITNICLQKYPALGLFKPVAEAAAAAAVDLAHSVPVAPPQIHTKPAPHPPIHTTEVENAKAATTTVASTTSVAEPSTISAASNATATVVPPTAPTLTPVADPLLLPQPVWRTRRPLPPSTVASQSAANAIYSSSATSAIAIFAASAVAFFAL